MTNMVADMEVDKVADKVADIVAENKEKIDIDINTEIQFGERFGHGGWLIGPKLFRPLAYLTCVSSKLCKFIVMVVHNVSHHVGDLVYLHVGQNAHLHVG